MFSPEDADIIRLVLVEEIESIVHEQHVGDAFMGLILVPLVEKAAEHLTGKVPLCHHSFQNVLRTLKPSRR